MNRTPQMFPKPPKKMLQPRKNDLRWRMELAEARLAYITTPRLWRLWHRIAARIKKGDAA